MIIIKRGDRSALADIVALIDRSFPAEYGEGWNARQTQSMLMLNNVHSYIAWHDQALAGFTIARTIADECELLLLAVDPDHRRCGIARQLLQQLTYDAREASARQVFLEMRAGNNAEHLYSDFGFNPIGRRANYYNGQAGKRYDAVTYRITL